VKRVILILLITILACCSTSDVDDSLITCAENEKDSEGLCYEPDDSLSGESPEGGERFLYIYDGTEEQANQIVTCIREYEEALKDFPSALVGANGEVSLELTDYVNPDGSFSLIDEALSDCE